MIRNKAGAPSVFDALEVYDDAMTYRLIECAQEELSVSSEELLRRFGHYWIHHIAAEKFSEIISHSGAGFVEFAKNIDHMHDRVKVIFPACSPPSFRVVELDEGLLLVDYYSSRRGLLSFVIGLFEGLASYFSTEITITQLDDAHGLPCERMHIRHGERAR